VAALLLAADVGNGTSYAAAVTELAPDCVIVRDGMVLDAELEQGSVLGVGAAITVDYPSLPHVVPLLLDSHLRPLSGDLRRQGGAACLSILSGVRLLGGEAAGQRGSDAVQAERAASPAAFQQLLASLVAGTRNGEEEEGEPRVLQAVDVLRQLLPAEIFTAAASLQAADAAEAAAASSASAASAPGAGTASAAEGQADEAGGDPTDTSGFRPAVLLQQPTRTVRLSSGGPYTPAWKSHPFALSLLAAAAQSAAPVSAAASNPPAPSGGFAGLRGAASAGSPFEGEPTPAGLTLGAFAAAAFPGITAYAAHVGQAAAGAGAASGASSTPPAPPAWLPEGAVPSRGSAGDASAPFSAPSASTAGSVSGSGSSGMWALGHYMDTNAELSLSPAAVSSMLLTAELYSKSRATIAQLAALASAPGGIRPFLRTGSGRLRAARAWTSINAQGRYVSDTDAKQAMAWAALRAAAARFLYPLRDVMVAFNVPFSAAQLRDMEAQGAGEVVLKPGATSSTNNSSSAAADGADAASSAAADDAVVAPWPAPEAAAVRDLRTAVLHALVGEARNGPLSAPAAAAAAARPEEGEAAADGASAAPVAAGSSSKPLRDLLPPLPPFTPAFLPLDPVPVSLEGQAAREGGAAVRAAAGGEAGAGEGEEGDGEDATLGGSAGADTRRQYPQLYPLSRLLAEWSPDIVTPPGTYGKFNSLRYFDWTLPEDRAAAEGYRRAEVPFVIRNIPALERTVAAWGVDATLMSLVGGSNVYSADASDTSHFMFYHKAGAKAMQKQAAAAVVSEGKAKAKGKRQQGGGVEEEPQDTPEDQRLRAAAAAAASLVYTPPTRTETITFREWLRVAYAVADEVSGEEAEQLPSWWGFVEEVSPVDPSLSMAHLPAELAQALAAATGLNGELGPAAGGGSVGGALGAFGGFASLSGGAAAAAASAGVSSSAVLARPPSSLLSLLTGMQGAAQALNASTRSPADGAADAAALQVQQAALEARAEAVRAALQLWARTQARLAASAPSVASDSADEVVEAGRQSEGGAAGPAAAAAAAAGLAPSRGGGSVTAGQHHPHVDSLPSTFTRGGVRYKAPQAPAGKAGKTAKAGKGTNGAAPAAAAAAAAAAAPPAASGDSGAAAAGTAGAAAGGSSGKAAEGKGKAGVRGGAAAAPGGADAGAGRGRILLQQQPAAPADPGAAPAVLDEEPWPPASGAGAEKQPLPSPPPPAAQEAEGAEEGAPGMPPPFSPQLVSVAPATLAAAFARPQAQAFPAAVSVPVDAADPAGQARQNLTLPLTAPPAELLPYLSWPAGVVHAYGLPSRRPIVAPLSRAKRTRYYLHLSDQAPPITPVGANGRSGPADAQRLVGGRKDKLTGSVAERPAGPPDPRDHWISAAFPFLSKAHYPHNDTSFFLPEVETHAGVHCRFGQPGIIAEAHYDSGRNFIAMARGYKRYVLAPPDQCPFLGLMRDGPSARHSALDWTALHRLYASAAAAGASAGGGAAKGPGTDGADPALLAQMASASALEVVLEPGDVLYIPPLWFHFIVSLTVNIQCNARTGTPPLGVETVAACGLPPVPVSEAIGVHTAPAEVLAAGGSGRATPRLLPPLEYASLYVGAEVAAAEAAAPTPASTSAAATGSFPNVGDAARGSTPAAAAAVLAQPLPSLLRGLAEAPAATLTSLLPQLSSEAIAAAVGGEAAAAATLGIAPLTAAGANGSAAGAGAASAAHLTPLEALVPVSARVPVARMVAVIDGLEGEADRRGDAPSAAVETVLAPVEAEAAAAAAGSDAAPGPADSAAEAPAESGEEEEAAPAAPTPGPAAAAAAVDGEASGATKSAGSSLFERKDKLAAGAAAASADAGAAVAGAGDAAAAAFSAGTEADRVPAGSGAVSTPAAPASAAGDAGDGRAEAAAAAPADAAAPPSPLDEELDQLLRPSQAPVRPMHPEADGKAGAGARTAGAPPSLPAGAGSSSRYPFEPLPAATEPRGGEAAAEAAGTKAGSSGGGKKAGSKGAGGSRTRSHAAAAAGAADDAAAEHSARLGTGGASADGGLFGGGSSSSVGLLQLTLAAVGLVGFLTLIKVGARCRQRRAGAGGSSMSGSSRTASDLSPNSIRGAAGGGAGDLSGSGSGGLSGAAAHPSSSSSSSFPSATAGVFGGPRGNRKNGGWGRRGKGGDTSSGEDEDGPGARGSSASAGGARFIDDGGDDISGWGLQGGGDAVGAVGAATHGGSGASGGLGSLDVEAGGGAGNGTAVFGVGGGLNGGHSGRSSGSGGVTVSKTGVSASTTAATRRGAAAAVRLPLVGGAGAAGGSSSASSTAAAAGWGDDDGWADLGSGMAGSGLTAASSSTAHIAPSTYAAAAAPAAAAGGFGGFRPQRAGSLGHGSGAAAAAAAGGSHPAPASPARPVAGGAASAGQFGSTSSSSISSLASPPRSAPLLNLTAPAAPAVAPAPAPAAAAVGAAGSGLSAGGWGDLGADADATLSAAGAAWGVDVFDLTAEEGVVPPPGPAAAAATAGLDPLPAVRSPPANAAAPAPAAAPASVAEGGAGWDDGLAWDE
jgi:hypothetical protein